MNLFTPTERKAIFSLLALMVIGLVVGEYRDDHAARVDESDDDYYMAFQEGAEAYRATSIDEPIVPVDINRSTAIELQQLPGVGPVMAKKIIDYRNKNGYFLTVEELINIDGVGPKSIERWRDLVFTATITDDSDSSGVE